jgi:hypothetical protein
MEDSHGHPLSRKKNRNRFALKITKIRACKLTLKTVRIRTDCVNGLKMTLFFMYMLLAQATSLEMDGIKGGSIPCTITVPLQLLERIHLWLCQRLTSSTGQNF